MGGAVDARVPFQELAGLRDLLWKSKVPTDLLSGFFAEQLGKCGTERAAGGFVLQFDSNLSAPRARRFAESNDTAVGHGRGALDGLPRDAFARAVQDDLSIPSNCGACRA